MKDHKKKKGILSKIFRKKNKIAPQSPPEEVLDAYQDGRVLSPMDKLGILRNFLSHEYHLDYKTNAYAHSRGRFMVTYLPKRRLLDICLPVFFNQTQNSQNFRSFYNQEILLFKKAIQEAWSNKFKLQTKKECYIQDRNMWNILNDVRVNVRVARVANSNQAFFNISSFKNIHAQSYRSNGAMISDAYNNSYQFAFRNYVETKRSLNSTDSTEHTTNVYAKTAGMMFGAGSDIGIESTLRALNTCERRDTEKDKCPHVYFYDPDTQRHKRVTYGEMFVIKGKVYVIKRGAIQWVQRSTSGELTYTNTSVHDPELAGCIGTQQYFNVHKVLGKEEALENATVNLRKKIDENNVMVKGTEVKKHHYVNFLMGMVKAIEKEYPNNDGTDPELAPNRIEDWTIA